MFQFNEMIKKFSNNSKWTNFFLKKINTITWENKPLKVCNWIKTEKKNLDRVKPRPHDKYITWIIKGEPTWVNLQNLWLRLWDRNNLIYNFFNPWPESLDLKFHTWKKQKSIPTKSIVKDKIKKINYMKGSKIKNSN